MLGLSSNAQGPNLPPGNPVNVVNCFQDFLATDSNSYKILGNQFQLLPPLGLTTFPGSFVLIKGYDQSGLTTFINPLAWTVEDINNFEEEGYSFYPIQIFEYDEFGNPFFI